MVQKHKCITLTHGSEEFFSERSLATKEEATKDKEGLLNYYKKHPNELVKDFPLKTRVIKEGSSYRFYDNYSKKNRDAFKKEKKIPPCK